MKKTYITLILIATSFTICVAQNTRYNNDSLVKAMRFYYDSIATVKRLEFLSTFDSIPDSTAGVFKMSSMNLPDIPEINRLKKVRRLDASKNKLIKIKAKDIDIDSLRSLNLSDNELKHINFPSNSMIKSLDLSGNNFRRIPRSIRKLKHLTNLTINQNQVNRFSKNRHRIKRIPRFFKKMTNLKSLEINFNKIKLSKRDVKRLSNIQVLVAAGNDIHILPENINDLKSIKNLNLSKNHIHKLPANFVLLDSLQSVIFYKNNFEKIPAEITSLTNLRIIDFYYNYISEIPVQIGNITNLKMLFLSYNNIEFLPDTIRSLHKLQAFYIHNNRLANIPNWITELTSLKILDISYNKLLSIPDMSNMTELYEIDIQENYIDHFPWKLMEKPNLKLLIIKGNPFILDKEEEEELKNTLKEKRAAGIVVVD